MAKSQLAYGVSLAAITVMMLGAAAQAQNVAAARADGGRGGGAHHHHNGGSGGGGNSQSGAVDPGLRGGTPGAGQPLPGISSDQMNFFTVAEGTFNAVDTPATGLGPGFNLDSCGGCHVFPATGGSSPPTNNPQIAVAAAMGATNVVPSFVTSNGPIREARFVLNPDGTPDGGVHDLFSIAGRSDAQGCDLAQPDFATQQANNNIIFRIPPPTYGAGLVESVSDASLQADFDAQTQQKGSLGISGAFNTSGNTGNKTRFGWKAQNISMLMFAGEAYNAEQGVTNELFPNERNNPDASCQLNALPEDATPLTDAAPSASQAADFNSDIVQFAMFMRLLAGPTPAIPLNNGGVNHLDDPSVDHCRGGVRPANRRGDLNHLSGGGSSQCQCVVGGFNKRGPPGIYQRRLLGLSHRESHHREFGPGDRGDQRDVQPVQRLRDAQHGKRACGSNFAGQCQWLHVPQRSAMGRRAARFLPA
jgi:hypothetical protein